MLTCEQKGSFKIGIEIFEVHLKSTIAFISATEQLLR